MRIISFKYCKLPIQQAKLYYFKERTKMNICHLIERGRIKVFVRKIKEYLTRLEISKESCNKVEFRVSEYR